LEDSNPSPSSRTTGNSGPSVKHIDEPDDFLLAVGTTTSFSPFSIEFFRMISEEIFRDSIEAFLESDENFLCISKLILLPLESLSKLELSDPIEVVLPEIPDSDEIFLDSKENVLDGGLDPVVLIVPDLPKVLIVIDIFFSFGFSNSFPKMKISKNPGIISAVKV